jgi:hypothetical protein
MIGCGSQESKPKTPDSSNKKSKAHYGALSGATVKIYEIGDEKKLLFTEKTTFGESIEEIGNFNMHEKELNSKKFYQFQITGGENWDIDKDGIKDSKPTSNSQMFRAIYKGEKSHVAWWGTRTESNVEKNSEKYSSKKLYFLELF